MPRVERFWQVDCGTACSGCFQVTRLRLEMGKIPKFRVRVQFFDGKGLGSEYSKNRFLFGCSVDIWFRFGFSSM